MIQGGGAQTLQIVRQATTTQNQIKLVWLYKRLADGEPAAFTMRKIIDHCWVEMKTKDNIDVQIDLFGYRSSLCGVKAPGAQQPSLT